VVRDGGASAAGEAAGEARFGRRPPKAQVGALEGFNLHASVVIGATDHEGRERLLRYVARPTVASGRMDWATLMHRVWGWDVLGCPRCGGRLRFIAVITQRAVIERILTHVGFSAARIVPAPARHFDDTS